MSRSTRYKVAREIIELKDRVDMDLILFSHEMKNDIEILTPARGPLGLISAFAGSVWKLDIPLTPEIESLIADYRPKNADVHEQKTRVASLQLGMRNEVAALQLGMRNEELGMEDGNFIIPKALPTNWIYIS